MLTIRFEILLMLSRWVTVTLSVVMFFPPVPQPRVSEGRRRL